MVDPVELDPGLYRGTYKLVGGSSALDFANLVSYRGTPSQHDWLDPLMNAQVWAKAAQLVAPSKSDIDRLVPFREVVAQTFLSVADGETPAADDLGVIGRVAAGVWAERSLHWPDRAPSAIWESPGASLLQEIALDAAALLTSPQALKLTKACPECRWLFLDTTRNHSRRWCDPADCSNRARQRRHYIRHKQG